LFLSRTHTPAPQDFTFCRFERYAAGLYPVEETRWYIPLTVGAFVTHCCWYYGWRPLFWTYLWGQLTFASVVVALCVSLAFPHSLSHSLKPSPPPRYTYYFDYSNSFEPGWDQLWLGKDFALEHLEEEGLGLSPGSLVNWLFGSQEPLNTRATLN
jgi:hypothetical protein